MKRTWRAILALTLVCAVALTAAAMALGSKALPLTMTDACTIGDPAAAEGLHMAARIGMEQNRLQWRMDYDPAADTTDASFRLAYSDRSGQWIFDGYGYNIQCLLVDQEDDSDPICREVLRQARASGEETVDVTVHLADYWQDLPLSLSGAPWSGGEDFIDVYGPWDIGDTVPFPALSIPVRASDDLTVALARNADGSYEINGYDFTGISSAMYFTPFSLPLEGGTLTTLGIDPAAQPQPDWAPEGYGLWYVPVQTDDDGSSTPVPSRRQLVYPLDITRQQVVTLKQEKLGGTVYLMTQEDGQLVLRLLEGGTYRLLQELSLGPAAEDSASYDLTIRDGFAVVLWEDQLTVLSRTEEGYHLDYTCPTQTAYVTGYTVVSGWAAFCCSCGALWAGYSTDEKRRTDNEKVSLPVGRSGGGVCTGFHGDGYLPVSAPDTVRLCPLRRLCGGRVSAGGGVRRGGPGYPLHPRQAAGGR